MKKLFSITAVAAFVAGSVAAAPPIVGGEGAGSATGMTIEATLVDGKLTVAYSGVVGTDIKAVINTPNPVPDGSVVCLKANGRQSRDWQGKVLLGSIIVTPETCSWGYGVVNAGKATVSVAACPAGRGQASVILSGVIQMPDGKQAWLPHPGPYRVFNAKGVDATAFLLGCPSGLTPLSVDKEMAKLF